jgi:hypothetical protein
VRIIHVPRDAREEVTVERTDGEQMTVPRSELHAAYSPIKRRRNPTRKPLHDYEVVVGNIGSVYSGRNGFEANKTYSTYVGQSKNGYGRAAGESVTLYKDGEITKEHWGTVENPKRRRNPGANAGRKRTAPARGMVKVMGRSVRKGSKRHAVLVQQQRIWDDLARGETGEGRSNPKRSRSRGTHRVKNGRSYAVRGHRPMPGYVPGSGKIFYLSGRKGVVRSVAPDERGVEYVWFRRPVDGTIGMSLANFRQATYIE